MFVGGQSDPTPSPVHPGRKREESRLRFLFIPGTSQTLIKKEKKNWHNNLVADSASHLWNARKPASHSYGYGVPLTEWPTDGVIARSWSSPHDRPPHGKASAYLFSRSLCDLQHASKRRLRFKRLEVGHRLIIGASFGSLCNLELLLVTPGCQYLPFAFSKSMMHYEAPLPRNPRRTGFCEKRKCSLHAGEEKIHFSPDERVPVLPGIDSHAV
ncbi:hypothetical protein CDAR_395171 [Caerostris darwini]|uniref:Uncharacterized protein n=1 Tax=Caerostris darwini TaxID=1538125 RepID=A0AAV4QB19_9ARAC|nr:hypothetical protein CDAR_395171 [Caerostris darwini]